MHSSESIGDVIDALGRMEYTVINQNDHFVLLRSLNQGDYGALLQLPVQNGRISTMYLQAALQFEGINVDAFYAQLESFRVD